MVNGGFQKQHFVQLLAVVNGLIVVLMPWCIISNSMLCTQSCVMFANPINPFVSTLIKMDSFRTFEQCTQITKYRMGWTKLLQM